MRVRDPKLALICVIGHFFEHLSTITLPTLGDRVSTGANTVLANCTIAAGVRIGCNCTIGLPGCGYEVVVGKNAVVIANTMLGGSVNIGAGVWVAPSVSIMNQATIGAGATLGLGAVVLKDVAAHQVIVGNPGEVLEKKPR